VSAVAPNPHQGRPMTKIKSGTRRDGKTAQQEQQTNPSGGDPFAPRTFAPARALPASSIEGALSWAR